MAQPTPYNRLHSFTDFAAGNPTTPLPGVRVDSELDAIETTLDATLTNLALIQRDDGALANDSVGPDQLNDAAIAVLALGPAQVGVPAGGMAGQVLSKLTGADYATAWVSSSGSGTVTSVSGAGTVSGLTLTGAVTGAGSLTLGGTLAVTAANFASQAANAFLAAPNGAPGNTVFRAIVSADIPVLNQAATGSEASLTTGRTIAMMGDVTWTTAAFNGSANVTAAGTIAAGAVTLAKMASMAAGSLFYGKTAGAVRQTLTCLRLRPFVA